MEAGRKRTPRFREGLGWSKFSKEDTTRVELGEIRQRTVTGLTLKELLPQGDYPHPGTIQAEKDPHLQVNHSLSTVHTLWIQTDRLLSDKHQNANTGRTGGRGIPWKQGSLWVTDGPDSVSNLEQWAQVYLQQHGQPGALNEYVIQQATMRTITIDTTSLPKMRDLLQQSMTWPTEQTISRELTYAEGPWDQDNRDSVLEQGYETSGLPPQACCPNKDCTQRMPIAVSGLRESTIR